MILASNNRHCETKTFPVGFDRLGQPVRCSESCFSQTWTQTSAPNTNWNSVAVSADGNKVVAVAGNPYHSGPIYTSSNMGGTWTQQTGAPFQGWGAVASSADGNTLVAESYAPYLYASTNSGVTWAQLNDVPGGAVVSMSPNGERLYAADGQYFYTSTNFGATWTTNVASGAVSEVCAASSDGSKIVTGGISGSVYTSTNYGATWKVGPSSGGWFSVASSADGSKFAAAPSVPNAGFYVLTSTNSGVRWITNQTLDNLPVHYLASSTDGNKLVVVGAQSGTNGGGIYTSTNRGISWNTNNVPLNYWISVASSADENTLVAAVNGGGIWISYTTPEPFLNIVHSNSNLSFSWTVPSTNLVLEQSDDLQNWTDVTNAPTLDLTNLQDEVVLSPTNSSGFYRLATP